MHDERAPSSHKTVSTRILSERSCKEFCHTAQLFVRGRDAWVTLADRDESVEQILQRSWEFKCHKHGAQRAMPKEVIEVAPLEDLRRSQSSQVTCQQFPLQIQRPPGREYPAPASVSLRAFPWWFTAGQASAEHSRKKRRPRLSIPAALK